MKKIWKVLLIVVALLVISFTIASACPPPPEKPVCGEGQITVEEAQLISGTTGYWVYKEVCTEVLVEPAHDGYWTYKTVWTDVPVVIGMEKRSRVGVPVWGYTIWLGWTSWSNGICTTMNSSIYQCEVRAKWGTISVPHEEQDQWIAGTPAVYETQCNNENDYWVNGTDSYYTDPVCRVPNGGCMDESALNFDPEAEVDVPEMCEYAEEGCAFTMYVLKGNGTCSLTRNYGLEDSAGKIPSRFVNGGELTGYGQELCNQCRTTEFKWDGGWTTTCDVPCVDCQ